MDEDDFYFNIDDVIFSVEQYTYDEELQNILMDEDYGDMD